jgi:uncharacterized protein (TIGR02284 family)
MTERLSRHTRRHLNALLVSSYDETLAFDEAAQLLVDPERRTWLKERSLRRRSFRRDLRRGVAALGGTPADCASLSARFRSVLRRLRRFVTGTHEGDAYGTCARAVAASVLAYGVTLQLELPDDIRFGLGRHYVELDADRIELRRLRWGAEPAPPASVPVTAADIEALNTRNWDAAEEERALDSWASEGGRLRVPASKTA